ncbi:phospholipid phosphatase 1-like [Plodia interpunctella]|uniref:phospholipid phosphatase 1-like n=1 Tax=Plodia interpunctella TaxID=58824 RepID=UPI003101A9EE
MSALEITHRYQCILTMYAGYGVARGGPGEISNLLKSRGVDHRAESYLTQRISLAIQWGNAASVMGTFASVAAICILLEVGALPSRRSGFTCNDPALSFPYTGDTFSISLVATVTVIVPFLIMWVVETIQHRDDEYSLKTNKLVTTAKTAGLMYRDYIYGAVVTLTVLEVVKCVIGSPRPTFFDLCEPDKAKTCNGSEYVSSYTCTSTKYSSYLKIDSGRSFPSAHAAMSTYCGLFLAWYLQRRAFSWHNRSVLIVPLIQALCLIYAAVCSLSRLTDHRHHWWDVLVGGSMGVLAVLYTILVLCKNFSQPAVVSTSDISSSDGNNHQSVRRLLSSKPHVEMP